VKAVGVGEEEVGECVELEEEEAALFSCRAITKPKA
jgi:hypothetical protein